jgi:hypothetical protein
VKKWDATIGRIVANKMKHAKKMSIEDIINTIEMQNNRELTK